MANPVVGLSEARRRATQKGGVGKRKLVEQLE